MSNDSWISGTVARGSGLGKILGFPTANLVLDNPAQRPPDGIYACWVKIGEKQRAGALHAGPRPVMGDAAPSIEVHILDFDGQDLYGQQIALQLVKRLRDIENFGSPEDLRKAIEEDCESVRRVLSA